MYLEPAKVKNTRGYFAIARVKNIVSDDTTPGRFLALIEESSYLDFANPVPFYYGNGPIERGLLKK